MRENEYDVIRRSIKGIELPQESMSKILQLGARKTYNTKRMVKRGLSIAACMIVTVLAVLFFPAGSKHGQGIVVNVYAAEQGTDQWTRIPMGEKHLLQPSDRAVGFGFAFRLELPEHYTFEQEGVVMGNDWIGLGPNSLILWSTHDEEETKYPLPDFMTASHRIRIYDEQGNLVETLVLQMTKDHEDRYVELLKIGLDRK